MFCNHNIESAEYILIIADNNSNNNLTYVPTYERDFSQFSGIFTVFIIMMIDSLRTVVFSWHVYKIYSSVHQC